MDGGEEDEVVICSKCGGCHFSNECPHFALDRNPNNLCYRPVPHMNETKVAAYHQKKLVSDPTFSPDLSGGGGMLKWTSMNFFIGFSCW